VVSNEQQKRKILMIDEEYIPMTKKMKRDPEIRAMMKLEGGVSPFSDGPYVAQVTRIFSIMWVNHLLCVYSNSGVQYPPVVG
jgi:hypothetical protein